MQPKTKILLLVLGILTIVLLVLAAQVVQKLPALQEEMRTTPTPMPRYGNMMQITPEPGSPNRAAMIKLGARGEHVTALQTRLQELGYYSGALDGQFGQGTQNAVTTFQEQHGLDADGIVGAETMDMLYSDRAHTYVTPTPRPTAIPTVTPDARPAAAGSSRPYIREDGLPLLVNKTYPLPSGYTTYDLVCMNDYCDPAVVKIKSSKTYAEREAVDALMVMLRAAQAEGVKPWQVSAAYRDIKYQQQLMDDKIREFQNQGFSYKNAVSAAQKQVAVPGSSEHHLGTCFDITVPGVPAFASTKQAQWLADNCWQYGFILRYAKDKEAITGFVAEAWHFRYVGAEHAIPMFNANLCLEEYLDQR